MLYEGNTVSSVQYDRVVKELGFVDNPVLRSAAVGDRVSRLAAAAAATAAAATCATWRGSG
jgi:hypothetical protein